MSDKIQIERMLEHPPAKPYNQNWRFNSRGAGYQDERFNQANKDTSGFEEVARLHQFNRRDRGLGYTEMLLAREDNLMEMLNGFKNPFTSAIASSLDSATQRVKGMRGQFDNIGAQLTASSLASTQGAQVAALNAARISSGRGGTAFGGGGAALAGRAAQGAASQQGASLAQALLQGTQLKGQFDLQQAGMEMKMANAMSTARARQAQIAESDVSRKTAAVVDFSEMFSGLGGNVNDADATTPPGLNLGIFGNWSF